MAQVAIPKAEVFGRCDGAWPWLGPAMKEKCEEMNRLLVRTASNAYFPERISVISLPDFWTRTDFTFNPKMNRSLVFAPTRR